MTQCLVYDLTTKESETFFSLNGAKKWMRERQKQGHEVEGSKVSVSVILYSIFIGLSVFTMFTSWLYSHYFHILIALPIRNSTIRKSLGCKRKRSSCIIKYFCKILTRVFTINSLDQYLFVFFCHVVFSLKLNCSI